VMSSSGSIVQEEEHRTVRRHPIPSQSGGSVT
jgi:hypothetical protein